MCCGGAPEVAAIVTGCGGQDWDPPGDCGGRPSGPGVTGLGVDLQRRARTSLGVPGEPGGAAAEDLGTSIWRRAGLGGHGCPVWATRPSVGVGGGRVSRIGRRAQPCDGHGVPCRRSVEEICGSRGPPRRTAASPWTASRWARAMVPAGSGWSGPASAHRRRCTVSTPPPPPPPPGEASLSSLTLSQTNVIGGNPVTGTVTLTAAAPSGG